MGIDSALGVDVGHFQRTAPRSRPIQIELSDQQVLPNGGVEGEKSLANVLVRLGNRSREMGAYFIRSGGELSGKPETNWNEVRKKHRYLKAHGFPVPPVIKFDAAQNRYIVTEMRSAIGGTLIDKHNPWDRATTPINNLDEVRTAVHDMGIRAFANGNGVYLGPDAYALFVNGGRADVYLLDIFAGTRRVHDYSARGGSGPIALNDDAPIDAATHFTDNVLGKY